MRYVDTLTLTAVGNPTPIIVRADAQLLILTEQARAGTRAFRIYAIDDATALRTPSIHPMGYEKRFERPGGYRKDEIIGYVNLTAGSATFILEHE